jgi:hypothetical protein
LIIRANPKYNIHEDLWCLYYPDDAVEQFTTQLTNMSSASQQPSPLDFSFAAFLCTLLPQTRDIMRNMQQHQQQQQYRSYQQQQQNSPLPQAHSHYCKCFVKKKYTSKLKRYDML